MKKSAIKKRPFKNTKCTIKEIKKINEEAKKPYRLKNHNVFRKYVLVIDSLPDKKAKQEAQGKSLEICIDQLQRNVINDEDFDKFTSVKNRYEFRTLTTLIKGMYNIMNKVKDDLEYFKEYDYVIKVDVVQIIINRIDNLKSDDIELNDKSYRWKGLFKDKTNNVIKYDKAWNANKNLFQYKAYNMDPNNETPLECVPNALFKMYGDKSKGKTYFNGKIANGGMEYIKKMLDIGGKSANLDCFDDNEPQIIEGKKGYSPMDILNFCNDHKIRCFGYDWMMNQFITKKGNLTNFFRKTYHLRPNIRKLSESFCFRMIFLNAIFPNVAPSFKNYGL